MDTNKNINPLNAQAEEQSEIMIGDDRELDAYVSMALRRRNVGDVDIDAEWRKLSSSLKATPRKGRNGAILRALMSAVVGAAAMFVFMLLFHDKVFSTASAPLDNKVAATATTAPVSKTAENGAQNSLVDSAKEAVLKGQNATPVVVAKAFTGSEKSQHVSTPGGMDLHIMLPDGSEAWLNAGSSLDFPSSFLSSERRVRLNGEAYFKVAHDKQRPFTVESDQMQVRVLGTEFNFKSYNSEPAHVTLVKGKVDIVSKNAERSVATLSPGEDAWYDRNGEIHISDADTYAVTQWVKGYFYFRDTPLADALKELGRWYNLGVVFNNPNAMDYKVHFSALRNAPISSALESLNRLQRITVRVENNNIVVY